MLYNILVLFMNFVFVVLFFGLLISICFLFQNQIFIYIPTTLPKTLQFFNPLQKWSKIPIETKRFFLAFILIFPIENFGAFWNAEYWRKYYPFWIGFQPTVVNLR